MKILLSFILLWVVSPESDPYADVSAEITAAIKNGNAKEITKHFNDKVDLKMFDKEDVFSKAQAEAILQDFFNKNKVKSFNTSHSSSNKGPNQFVVGILETSGGKFRVSFLIKKLDAVFLVSQFRIEKENE